MSFIVTPAAQKRIMEIAGNGAQTYFRVRIESGGCSGFQYQFMLTDAPEAGDHTFPLELDARIHVLIDDVSLGLIENSVLDFTQDLAQSTFVLQNPNAVSKCGCGNSFSL